MRIYLINDGDFVLSPLYPFHINMNLYYEGDFKDGIAPLVYHYEDISFGSFMYLLYIRPSTIAEIATAPLINGSVCTAMPWTIISARCSNVLKIPDPPFYF
mgnify:CR=1 FL=1